LFAALLLEAVASGRQGRVPGQGCRAGERRL